MRRVRHKSPFASLMARKKSINASSTALRSSSRHASSTASASAGSRSYSCVTSWASSTHFSSVVHRLSAISNLSGICSAIDSPSSACSAILPDRDDQALGSHPRTSGGDRNPGGLCRQHNLGRLLPPGPPNTNPPRHPPHSLEPSSWLCYAKLAPTLAKDGYRHA